MTDVLLHDTLPSAAPAPTPARPRLLVIATTLVSVAASMGMAGLVGIYLETRAEVIQAGTTWLPDGVAIPLTQPNMMAVTLIFSVLAMLWARSSIQHDDRPHTHMALGLCLLFGFAYITQSAYLLTIMEIPIAGDSPDLARPPLLFAIIGFHMVLAGLAMIYALAMGVRTLGGNYSAKDVEGINGVAIFWTVMVVLYLVVWYSIYITK